MPRRPPGVKKFHELTCDWAFSFVSRCHFLLPKVLKSKFYVLDSGNDMTF